MQSRHLGSWTSLWQDFLGLEWSKVRVLIEVQATNCAWIIHESNCEPCSQRPWRVIAIDYIEDRRGTHLSLLQESNRLGVKAAILTALRRVCPLRDSEWSPLLKLRSMDIVCKQVVNLYILHLIFSWSSCTQAYGGWDMVNKVIRFSKLGK